MLHYIPPFTLFYVLLLLSAAENRDCMRSWLGDRGRVAHLYIDQGQKPYTEYRHSSQALPPGPGTRLSWPPPRRHCDLAIHQIYISLFGFCKSDVREEAMRKQGDPWFEFKFEYPWPSDFRSRKNFLRSLSSFPHPPRQSSARHFS